MYRKNLFGDITAIYKGTTKMAEYVYDAWGNCTITLDKKSCGTGNPFRYRGYYFDNDLQMYYLLTRYYDPQIGRFINADSIEYLEPNTINGLNLYAYCGNNPVMHTDPYGTDISYTWGGDEGYNVWDEWWIYSGSNGASGGYYGENTAYYTYSVYSNTAAYNASHDGYYHSGVSSGVLNPTYYIVPGATTVTDSMATDIPTYNLNGSKGESYITNRGWDVKKINFAVYNGPQGTSINRANGYRCRVSGYPGLHNQYVIIEYGSRNLVQVSDLNDSNWCLDRSIVWNE